MRAEVWRHRLDHAHKNMAAWCQVGVNSDSWQCLKLNISRTRELIFTPIFISIKYCWLENTYLNIKRGYVVHDVRFPVISDVIFGAAYGQISLLFSHGHNFVHMPCIVTCYISNERSLQDLFILIWAATCNNFKSPS